MKNTNFSLAARTAGVLLVLSICMVANSASAAVRCEYNEIIMTVTNNYDSADKIKVDYTSKSIVTGLGLISSVAKKRAQQKMITDSKFRMQRWNFPRDVDYVDVKIKVHSGPCTNYNYTIQDFR